MIVDLSQTQRTLLLLQLRNAVALQIELWKLMSDMAEQLKCEKLEEVADRVQALSITPETGLGLNFNDLDEFLGIAPSRTKIGRSLLDNSTIQ